MSDFKAKMHQIRFRTQTPLGELMRSPRPLAGFTGPTSKGREGKGGNGRGREGPTYKRREVKGGREGKKGKGGEGKGWKGRGGKWRGLLIKGGR